VDLVVRGNCCQRPGVEGVSENIRVRSVVDRFLEHERILVFGIGKRSRMYLSSADWMPRNFLRRVELTWPVKDPALQKRIYDEILYASLNDNRKAWILGSDGAYTRVARERGVPVLRSQAWLLENEHRLANSPHESMRQKRSLLRGAVALETGDGAPGAAPIQWRPILEPPARRRVGRKPV
jgi:polyphosphate kinase